MKSLKIRQGCALAAATLFLPVVSYAGTDNGKGNDGQNNGNQFGHQVEHQNNGRHEIHPMPDGGGTGIMLALCAGGLLLFSLARRFLGAARGGS